MSTITRELAKLFRKITNSEIDAEGNAHVVLSPADSLLINNARIALASLEAEPVAWLLSGGGAKNNVSFDSGNAYADPLREVTPLYTAPPAPVSVPAAMEIDDDFDSAFEHGKAVGWNAYRAAMLQAEPVSNSDELPLDYLQGHKDGLEWAAQLAEANHPQTGDWLYDDPIDLARAIRKGPDMPTVQGGNSPVTPDGWISCSERMPEKGQNVLISVNFDSSLVEPLICSARYTGSTFRRGEATIKPGNGIEQATHWMPLSEPPQEVNRG
ncbi:DUF551 domain-containing protein [Salmonella enterica subsp. enterica serovar Roodepoort]|nr:DUF551 domain-containing protein [Salmonella enterica]EBN9190877.1 DUF551 domain-containing protein [Salmonella enterica subsp. enterica serovar Roodepoort]EDR5840817.1 DUF551 domain-containing protein [Salmonella enterica subsp. enterica serovar Roodepoort]EEE3033257.1 DUF551 domain-containing protein [Salmonella enterica subsp. enterica serovar Roodepoort]